MPLQTSGPISLLNIAQEFGGATPHSINEYYAGGAYVPPGTAGTSGNIPSSSAISFGQFYGAPVAVVDLVGGSVSALATGSNPYAYYRVDSSGFESLYTTPTGGSGSFTRTWLLSGSASDYEVAITSLGFGSTPLGYGINTWYNLGTNDVQWYVSRSTVGGVESGFTVSIRRALNGVILDTVSVSLYAERY